jgi:hypothetical protein
MPVCCATIAASRAGVCDSTRDSGHFPPPSNAKTRRVPEIGGNLANTCQHFRWQNAVFMCHQKKSTERNAGLCLCGFQVVLNES